MTVSPTARIEVAGRLVGEQDRGLADQCTRYGHALLLATGELRGIVTRAVRHADALQSLLDTAAAFGTADLGPIGERQLHVFPYGQTTDQVERLEHETDLGIADACTCSHRERSNVEPIEHVAA